MVGRRAARMAPVYRMIMVIVAVFAATRRTDAVTHTPTAVIVAGWFIVAAVISDTAFDSHARHGTGGQ
jgi:peptidoglycan/LPS O-acetylase OafA/YrhL